MSCPHERKAGPSPVVKRPKVHSCVDTKDTEGSFSTKTRSKASGTHIRNKSSRLGRAESKSSRSTVSIRFQNKASATHVRNRPARYASKTSHCSQSCRSRSKTKNTKASRPKRADNDIIIRNKKAIKCLSKKCRELRMQQKKLDSGSRSSCYKKSKGKKRKRKMSRKRSSERLSSSASSSSTAPSPSHKPSCMAHVIHDDDCVCELTSNALRKNVHRFLGLSRQRDAINTGSPDFSTPKRPTPGQESDQEVNPDLKMVSKGT